MLKGTILLVLAFVATAYSAVVPLPLTDDCDFDCYCARKPKLCRDIM